MAITSHYNEVNNNQGHNGPGHGVQFERITVICSSNNTIFSQSAK